MHTEVRRTKSLGIKVTNEENGTEEPGIIGFVSHEGYCVDKVTRGPLGHESEGHQRRGRTRLTSRGHRGHTGLDMKHTSDYDSVTRVSKFVGVISQNGLCCLKKSPQNFIRFIVI